MKNHVNTFWTDYNDSNENSTIALTNSIQTNETTKKFFVIDENDKEYLRNVLLDAIIRTKDPLRCQLITAAGSMIKTDFPTKWNQFLHQIHNFLSTENLDTWQSVLLVFYTLVQHFEYKKAEDRVAIDDVMNVLLPLLHQRFMQLFTRHDSDQSALIEKQILKIFHAYTQVKISIKNQFENFSFRFSLSFSFI